MNFIKMSNKPEEKLVPVKWSKESDEELKRLIEESKATVNWTEVAKWEAKGRPYEIDEEILLFYKDELTNLGSNGKSTNLYSTSCTCICLTSLLIFKEPGFVTLTETDNRFLEMLLTQVPGREIVYLGTDAIINLPLRNPPPPKVTLVNIVIKLLDPINFPVQSQNARGMINELSTLGFLHGVIGLNVMGRIRVFREYDTRVKKFNPAISVYDIVPKGDRIYALILPDGNYIILCHLRDIWFRALAFFTDHSSYSNFLSVHYTNRTMFP